MISSSSVAEEKLAAFSQWRVKHPRIEEVLNEMALFLAPHAGVDILLLIGITGVGKTTLAASLMEKTFREHFARIEEQPEYIPAISIEAPSAGGQRAFSWRLLYEAMLEELFEPLIDRKISSEEMIRYAAERKRVKPPTLTGLRKATEIAINGRQCRFLLVDEAVHILQQASLAELVASMNTLKSLANRGNATIVLVGSYDLFEVLKINGQLARRCHSIHFTRYKSTNDADKECFATTAMTLASKMELDIEIDIGPYVGVLMESCIGCVGIMKDVLQRAYTLAIMNGGHWKGDYIERCLLTKTQTETILKEALAGEEAMRDATNWATLMGR